MKDPDMSAFQKIDEMAKTYVKLRGDQEIPEWRRLRDNLQKENDEVSAKFLAEFDLAVEAHASIAFFQEIEVFLKEGSRLSWLAMKTMPTIAKRWSFETHKSRIKAVRYEAAKSKLSHPIFTKEQLEEELKNPKLASNKSALARRMGVNVKTLKSHAASFGVELQDRPRLKRVKA
jgi:hypothetical protein